MSIQKGQRQHIMGYANVFDDFGRWLFYQGASAAVPYEHRNAMFATLLGKITQDYQVQRRKLQWVRIHDSPKGDGVAARGTWVMLSPNRFVLATTGPNLMGQKDLGHLVPWRSGCIASVPEGNLTWPSMHNTC